jgi:microcystin-dependent protein
LESKTSFGLLKTIVQNLFWTPFRLNLMAVTVLGGAGTVTVNANTGGGQPLNINLAIPVALNAVPLAVNVPTLNLNFIIAITGIFPTRP